MNAEQKPVEKMHLEELRTEVRHLRAVPVMPGQMRLELEEVSR